MLDQCGRPEAADFAGTGLTVAQMRPTIVGVLGRIRGVCRTPHHWLMGFHRHGEVILVNRDV